MFVHGGIGGVGIVVIQVVCCMGARVLVIVGLLEWVVFCRELGADEGIDYNREDFVERICDLIGECGAELILDVIGAVYLECNLCVLVCDGRLVIIGMQGGIRVEIDFNMLLFNRFIV